MKQTLNNYKKRLVVGVACIAVGVICWNGGNRCQAQTPANSSPALQEVVKLTKAQMGDDVIVAYINNSGTTFNLSADDMLYLQGQGVSQPVMNALLHSRAATPAPVPVSYTPPAPMQQPPLPAQAKTYAPSAIANDQVPPPPPPDQEPPPGPPTQDVSPEYFHAQLAPFGTWVNVGGVEYWRPDQAVAANPDWRPYYDMGRWVQTDNGLFWQSDYTWGDIPFHYGRWMRDPGMGWLWAPDYTWGPSWVFWRHAEEDGAVGWAPLPVGAVFVDGVFMFNGVRVGLDFDFGLGEGCFTFVDFAHFHEGFFRMRGREFRYHIHGDRFHNFYRRSVVRNDFRRDEHGRFVNHGIGRERMEQATRGRVERASLEERNPVGDRDKLAAERGGKTASSDGGRKAAAPSKAYRPPTTPTRTAAAPAPKPAAKQAPAPAKKK